MHRASATSVSIVLAGSHRFHSEIIQHATQLHFDKHNGATKDGEAAAAVLVNKDAERPIPISQSSSSEPEDNAPNPPAQPKMHAVESVEDRSAAVCSSGEASVSSGVVKKKSPKAKVFTDLRPE